jgi:hypothetical protein
MNVDEPGRDAHAAGFEDPRRAVVHLADGDDLAAADADVALARRGAGTVDDRTAVDQEIELLGYGLLLCVGKPALRVGDGGVGSEWSVVSER